MLGQALENASSLAQALASRGSLCAKSDRTAFHRYSCGRFHVRPLLRQLRRHPRTRQRYQICPDGQEVEKFSSSQPNFSTRKRHEFLIDALLLVMVLLIKLIS